MSTMWSNVPGSRDTGAAATASGSQEHAIGFVLHVHHAPEISRDPDQRMPEGGMGSVLTGAPFRVVGCSSVYHALARLLRSGDHAPSAVVVALDSLNLSEVEFFSIVSRVQPSLPLYVYTQTQAESRMAAAMAAGAIDLSIENALPILESGMRADQPVAEAPLEGSVTPRSEVRVDSLSPVAEETDASPEPATPTGSPWYARGFDRSEPMPDVPVGPTAPVYDGPPPASPDESAPVCYDEEQQGETMEEVDAVAPTRVPWQGRTDAPARRPPAGGVPPRRSRPSPHRAREVDEPDIAEPLLTQDELRALLANDDIAALAPDLPEPDLSDEGGDGL